MPVKWTPEARADLGRLYAFLEKLDHTAADKALDEIIEGGRKLLGFPDIGRPMNDGSNDREFFIPFGGGQYVLRYRLSSNTVIVIRVWHSREAR